MPADFEWPTMQGFETITTKRRFFGVKRERKPTDKRQPLSLLAQINLAESPPGFLSELPPVGHLLFFFDMEAHGTDSPGASNETHRVILLPDGATLHRMDPGLLPGRHPHRSLPVTLKPTYSIDSVCFDLVQKDALEVAWNLLTKWSVGNITHQLLGCPCPLQGRPGYYPDIALHGEAKTAATTELELAKRWRLLLQLDEQDSLDWRWGDGGMAYFMIPPDDLAAARFNKAVPELQSC